MKVLIVEDDPTSRLMLTKILKKNNYNVVGADSGKEALEHFQGEDYPRILILDWVMPEMDGLQVLRKVRNLNLPISPYIIMLTVHNKKQNIVEALGNGADDYLSKPCIPEELFARIEVGFRVIKLQNNLIKKNKELDDFAYKVSHDLKNPIQIIKGFLENIKKDPSNFDKFYPMIISRANNLLLFINRILQLSKSGKAIGSKVQIDPEELLQIVFIPINKNNFPTKLIVNSSNLTIWGCPHGMEQVFINLIKNSISFRDPDKGELIIQVDIINEGEYSIVRYRDNGIGIDKDKSNKVFSAGFTTNPQGTGFGLAIIKKIIESHGGQVSCLAKGIGNGVEFILKLPNDPGKPGGNNESDDLRKCDNNFLSAP